MPTRRIEYVPLDEIARAPRNPKGHDAEGIAASVRRFGIVEIVVEDERTGRLVSGHGRLDAFVEDHAAGADPPDGIEVDGDGRWLVPVVRGWASADDDEADAALVAVNRLVERGGWAEPDELVAILSGLRERDRLDLAVGYSSDDLDQIIAGLADTAPAPAPVPPPPEPVEVPARVQRGDLWALGPHRLLCGDCRVPGDVDRLLGDVAVNVAFTSPPYADRRKYDAASGFVPIHPDGYVEWFESVAANVVAHLADDGSWFVNIKAASNGLDTETYVLDLVLAHARRWGWHFASEFCWERSGAPGKPARRFKNQFEPVYHFARGEWKFNADAVMLPSTAAFEYEQGKGKSLVGNQGAQRERWFQDHDVGDGLAYPGNRLPTFAGSHEALGHSAAFPVGLPAWFLRAYSDPGDTVFDPFVGSGSTLLAAEQEGRIGYGSEISEGYCDVILARWEAHGGTAPVLVDRTVAAVS